MIAQYPMLQDEAVNSFYQYYTNVDYYTKFLFSNKDLIQSNKNSHYPNQPRISDLVIAIITNKLVSVNQSIEKSKYILDLIEGWDGEDAIPISKILYKKTINYLLELGGFIYDEFNVDIIGPEINPCRDGSIDLEWKINQVHLLINVKELNDTVDVHYYGIDLNSNNSIKGIKKSLKINEDLAFWMKKLV